MHSLLAVEPLATSCHHHGVARVPHLPFLAHAMVFWPLYRARGPYVSSPSFPPIWLTHFFLYPLLLINPTPQCRGSNPGVLYQGATPTILFIFRQGLG